MADARGPRSQSAPFADGLDLRGRRASCCGDQASVEHAPVFNSRARLGWAGALVQVMIASPPEKLLWSDDEPIRCNRRAAAAGHAPVYHAMASVARAADRTGLAA
jgi:hypothetical protein